MDPVTLALLTSAAGTALSNAGTLVGGASLQTENKRRLAELKKKEEMGALGLTAKEEAAISGRLRGAQESAIQASEDLQKRLLAGGGMATGGQALAGQEAATQARMQAESQIAQQVLEQDLAREQAQKDEMRALEAAVAQRRAEAIGAASGIVGAGLEAGLTTAAQQATIQGQKDIAPTQVAALAGQLGVSEEEARGIYEMALRQPEMLKYIGLLKGTK